MKSKLLIQIALIFTFLVNSIISFGQANTELSNLLAPTKVNVHLLPQNDNNKNLGSTSKSWKDIYFDGALYFDDVVWLHNASIVTNSFLGSETGLANTTGNANTGLGYRALFLNNTGSQNTAIGMEALAFNIANSNTATGHTALHENTTGSENSAFGADALYFNTTGSRNTAVGLEALILNTTGNDNTALGNNALGNNSTGHSNTSAGVESGNKNTTGFQNAFFGYDAGGSNTTGDNNTHIGFSSEGNGAGYNNSHSFGYQVSTTASNQVRIGNSAITSIGGFAEWTNISDGRVKENVREDVKGLDFITKLRPVTYTLNVNGIDAFIGNDVARDHETEESKRLADIAAQEKAKIVYTGFIAQEVEAAAKEIGYDFSGVDVPKNEKDLYGLRYAEFVVPLVKAVQELSATNEKLQTENTELKSRLDKIETVLNISETASNETNYQDQKVSLSSNSLTAVLGQNVPNPFNEKTTIPYFIPENSSNATINFYSERGELIKSVSISGKGYGQISVNAGDLASGIYQYSLIVNGKISATKKFIITK